VKADARVYPPSTPGPGRQEGHQTCHTVGLSWAWLVVPAAVVMAVVRTLLIAHRRTQEIAAWVRSPMRPQLHTQQALMWVFAPTLPWLHARANPHLPLGRSLVSPRPPGAVGSSDARSLPSQWRRPSVGDPASAATHALLLPEWFSAKRVHKLH